MPFTYTLEVRWSDCDSYRHVNNAVYLSYFEEGRAHFWQALRGEAFTGYDFIIAEITCTYRSPATVGELLTVAVHVTEVGTKSFQLAYRITETATGREVATGRSAQVMYDHDLKVSFPIGEALRAQLQAAIA